jgi:hypothetical protein
MGDNYSVWSVKKAWNNMKLKYQCV